jgi:hypothetical protein
LEEQTQPFLALYVASAQDSSSKKPARQPKKTRADEDSGMGVDDDKDKGHTQSSQKRKRSSKSTAGSSKLANVSSSEDELEELEPVKKKVSFEQKTLLFC